MRWEIFIIGKPQTFYLDALEEYRKRLSRDCKIRLHTLKNPGQLRKKWPADCLRLRLVPGKTRLTSEKWAHTISGWQLRGKSRICVIIGEHNVTADQVISISPLDMDPYLTAVLLAEQIYRGYRILEGHGYHK